MTSISATAADNVRVSKVEFYVGTALVCTDTTSPYTCSSDFRFAKPNLQPAGQSLRCGWKQGVVSSRERDVKVVPPSPR